MIKCKQATQLMSQSQDRELMLKEKVLLKFHLLICSGCKRCNKQMSLMRAAIRQLGNR